MPGILKELFQIMLAEKPAKTFKATTKKATVDPRKNRWKDRRSALLSRVEKEKKEKKKVKESKTYTFTIDDDSPWSEERMAKVRADRKAKQAALLKSEQEREKQDKGEAK